MESEKLRVLSAYVFSHTILLLLMFKIHFEDRDNEGDRDDDDYYHNVDNDDYDDGDVGGDYCSGDDNFYSFTWFKSS